MSSVGRYRASITNQFTGGGSKKAGIPSTVGRNQFAYSAMTGKAGRAAMTIPHWSIFNVSSASQIGGVGRGKSMFALAANSGGVNLDVIELQRARIRRGPPMW